MCVTCMHMMQSEYVCVNIEHRKQCVCVCACDHVFMCTAALLAWCVEHCKPISQSRIWYTKTPSKHFLEFIQWNGLGAWKLSSIGCKAGRTGLSGEIDLWQLYCPKHPWMAGLWKAWEERGRNWTDTKKREHKRLKGDVGVSCRRCTFLFVFFFILERNPDYNQV